MELKSNKFWHWFSVITVLVSIWYLNTQSQKLHALNLIETQPQPSSNLPSLPLAIISLSLAAALFFLIFLKKRTRETPSRVSLPFWLSAGLVIFMAVAMVFFFSMSDRQAILGVNGRLLFSIWGAGAAAWLLESSKTRFTAIAGFSTFLLLVGFFYRVALFIPDMQSVPFSLGWSEGSRYYNASLFLAQQLYGAKFPLPVLHPARYFLQAIPFLVAPQSILIHRIWQVVLWLGTTLLGAYTMQKRFKVPNRRVAGLITLWLFLFFFQGAVYYHLMVCVILVLTGYKKDSFWRTTIVVLIASIWAGLCRVNWYPVPALLAVSLYLIEEPLANRGWINYLKRPALWAILGILTAFASNRIYALFSGNDTTQFTSSLSSYMIWSRLFPNTTFDMGIVIASILVSLPLLLAAWLKIRAQGWRSYWQWTRVLGLTAILAVFALGGIVVSVKVGGGGDLHNLDAYLVFLALIIGMIVFDRYSLVSNPSSQTFRIPVYVLLLLILVPIYFTLRSQSTWRFRSYPQEQKQLMYLRNALDIIEKETPGPVLFIAERQLVTFGNLSGFNIEPDYEKVFLMEMVMSNNQPYLETFQEKLRDHQYAAIISDSLFAANADQDEAFWVENNLWIDKVVYPMLEQYETVLSLQDGGVNLLIPRQQEDLYDKVKKALP